MTEQLPITITINSELLDTFSKIQSVCNKLEAQFNFQTLTANWYGDEENILTIQLSLETPTSFRVRQDELQNIASHEIAVKHFSDDVVSSMSNTEQQLHCYIAMTTSELDLLIAQPKLLAGFIQIKLHKVLNLIAEKQSLAQI